MIEVRPLTPSIGEPSKFPTQTATVTSRVNPTVQLSRYPFDVPVFAATGNGSSSALRSPNDARRASLSASTSVIAVATARGITRRGSAAGASTALPPLVRIARTALTGLQTPPRASVA